VLRALVSADSAPSAWDLRCEVRERLLAWLQRQHPEALPRLRTEMRAPAPPGPLAAGVSDWDVPREGEGQQGRGARR